MEFVPDGVGQAPMILAEKTMEEPEPIRGLCLSVSQSIFLFREWLAIRLGRAPVRIPNRQIVIHLDGSLNIQALEGAIGQIVNRHQILRVRFLGIHAPSLNVPQTLFNPVLECVNSNKGLADLFRLGILDFASPLIGPHAFQQALLPSADVKLSSYDLKDLPEGSAVEELIHSPSGPVQAPFAYEGPLIRFVLYKMTPAKHSLVVVVHPIIADGRSLALLVRELAALLRTYSSYPSRGGHERPIQYWDFARWERILLQGQYHDLLRYWNARLSLMKTSSFTDLRFSRPAIPTSGALVEQLLVDDQFRATVKHLTRKHAITPYMLFLTGLALLLHLYSGIECVAIRGTQLNRTQPGSEALIGWLSNNHALIVNCAGNPTAISLMRQVREVVCGTYDNQSLPTSLLWTRADDSVLATFGLTPAWDVLNWPEGLAVDVVMEKAPPRGLNVRILEGRNRMTIVGWGPADQLEPSELRKALRNIHSIVTAIAENPERTVMNFREVLAP